VTDWQVVFWLAQLVAYVELLCDRNRFFDSVDTSITGRFTPVLCRVLSGVHNLLFSEMHKTTVYVPLECNNGSAVSAKTAEMQFTSGYF